MGRRLGLGLVSVLGCWSVPLLAVLSGCSNGDVSAGNEGPAINLARCFGADCGTSAQAMSGSEVTAEACGEVAGQLEDPVDFETLEGLHPIALRAAPDGSFWVLTTTEPVLAEGPPSPPEPVLVHYSGRGKLLGNSGPIAEGGNDTELQTLAVDAAGVASVAVYRVFAPNADSELDEHLTLFTYDPNGTPFGAAVALRGISAAHLATDPTGSVMLAGNASGNAKHGVLARLVASEPSWIQTKVPTSGQGAGVGVSGVVVDAEGASAVLSVRSSHDNTDADEYGIATFDAQGSPLWDLELPTSYGHGYPAELAQQPGGDLIVAAVTHDNHVLVRRVSHEGVLGWSFEVPGSWADLAVDEATGQSVAGSRNALAVIDADGQSCKLLGLPPEDADYPDWGSSVGKLVVQSPYIYMTMRNGVRRLTIPEE